MEAKPESAASSSTHKELAAAHTTLSPPPFQPSLHPYFKVNPAHLDHWTAVEQAIRHVPAGMLNWLGRR